jgi:hypothetical protein
VHNPAGQPGAGVRFAFYLAYFLPSDTRSVPSILIVEDSPDNPKLCRTVLAGETFTAGPQ